MKFRSFASFDMTTGSRVAERICWDVQEWARKRVGGSRTRVG
jgi:hypothetical protein